MTYDEAMEACDETVVYLGGPYMIDLPRLMDTRVFTHRVTSDDVSGEVIELYPDCAALLPRLSDLPVTAAVEEVDDTPIRSGPVSVAGAEPVAGELIGLDAFVWNKAMLLLPEGTLPGAGISPGDLIAIRLRDGTVHIDVVAEDIDIDPDIVDFLKDSRTRPRLPSPSPICC